MPSEKERIREDRKLSGFGTGNNGRALGLEKTSPKVIYKFIVLRAVGAKDINVDKMTPLVLGISENKYSLIQQSALAVTVTRISSHLDLEKSSFQIHFHLNLGLVFSGTNSSCVARFLPVRGVR